MEEVGVISAQLIKYPTAEDWHWVKTCTLNTVGKKKVVNEPDAVWKKKLLESEHSPIRELWFGFRLEIPYWVSVHVVRHHIGCNHYVSTQRDDRQKEITIPRAEKPQGEMVSHIFSVNAQELVQFMHKRLCNQASLETRQLAEAMRQEVLKVCPEFESVLVPLCVYRNGKCTEMFPCGKEK